ncbi:uncharacterized protein LOC110055409 [Orbicella faveolata]|uniref:uncharacterized protein LOC110055409 n=1 Tax=Orbicella faveolata TaxID=48498 RepID=UPI0009E5B920|nr:uncharacterized protein LOC110055409 [Orbicella faveolata]
MGCSGSAPIQEFNAEENEAGNLSKENSVKEIADQPRQEKADGIETTANSLQDTNPTEGNQLGPDKEINNLKRSRPKRDREQIIDNAWSISKVKKNVKNLESSQSRPKPEGLVDLESEYGKDGVDLASSHVYGDHQDKEKLINHSLGARMSPDGTYSVDNSERMSKRRSFHKEDTDEVFDPSALIDIEKFRAVNAPTKQISTSNSDSGKPNVGTDKNDNEQEVTADTIEHKEAEIVVIKPPNYSEMYDDDEKQLIASIENDFKNISPIALPGSVM